MFLLYIPNFVDFYINKLKKEIFKKKLFIFLTINIYKYKIR